MTGKHRARAQRPHWAESVAHPVRTFHTVRHLRTRQVVARALRLVRPSTPSSTPLSDLSLVRRAAVGPADPGRSPYDGHSFQFLNRRIAWGGADRWQPRGADDLWTYNLNYFRFIWSLPASTATALVADWIAANRDRTARGWDAYPLSLRIREWVEWRLAHPEIERRLADTIDEAIVQQTATLRQRLEFHLLGNHLLENAITLCWAGASFHGAAADEWLNDGQRILREQIAEQVLSDGSHDERSPMYQALLVEALLRLAEVARQSSKPLALAVVDLARGAGERMLRTLAGMTHPDGGYALLNDTALGIAPAFDSLTSRFDIVLADGPERALWSLPSAGYAGYQTRGGHYLVFDGGPIGPDHQPGHGHADTLSFELSARGERLITDTGVFTYAPRGERAYDRGTAAHNTVEIDGQDQCELWGAFRCARRPTVATVRTDLERDGASLAGRYRGPRRGLRSVAHSRQIFMNDHVLSFVDRVQTAGVHRATVRLHFAPGLRLRKGGGGWVVEADGRRRLASVVGDRFDWSESRSPYHPEFGREVERTCLSAPVVFRDRADLRWWLLLR